jgi:2-phospho-L-lactate/phosphoenolpyruvate guanylyltransferase
VPTVAVLPVNSFRRGKRRLAEALPDDTRAHLGRKFAERTADLTIEAGMVPILVAGDAEVATWAFDLGFPTIPDPGDGLNAAAEAGVLWATESASAWLVIHTDLPLLTRGDVEGLLMAMERNGRVIAPSADGGTSALGGNGAGRFSYGPGSFHHHLGRYPDSEIVARTGLLLDIDTIADLDAARLHSRGMWLGEIA